MKRNVFLAILLSAAVVALTGCATGTYHWNRAESATQTFMTAKIDTGYQYYISGHDFKPVAIVGIKKDYTLEKGDWQKVDVDSTRMRLWVERMLAQPGAEYNIEPNGAYILDNNGNAVGVWFSVFALPQVTFTSETSLAITRPMTVFPWSNRNRNNGDDGGVWPHS